MSTSIWQMPTAFMQEASVLKGPTTWVLQPETLVIDITPKALVGRIDYSSTPFDTETPFTHFGYTPDLGPISADRLGQWRLRQGSRDFKILKIQDWDGFYVLELDEIQGG